MMARGGADLGGAEMPISGGGDLGRDEIALELQPFNEKGCDGRGRPLPAGAGEKGERRTGQLYDQAYVARAQLKLRP